MPCAFGIGKAKVRAKAKAVARAKTLFATPSCNGSCLRQVTKSFMMIYECYIDFGHAVLWSDLPREIGSKFFLFCFLMASIGTPSDLRSYQILGSYWIHYSTVSRIHSLMSFLGSCQIARSPCLLDSTFVYSCPVPCFGTC